MSDLILTGISYEGDKTIFRHTQEINDCLADNQEQRNNTSENWDSCKTMKRVGSIPFAVWLLWESTGITDNPKELLKALERNPEYKTTEKKLT